ncbi:MAG: methyltransferase [Bacteroidota bacterium]
MQFSHRDRHYSLARYPASSNRSLQAVSAADELLLQFAEEEKADRIVVQHDRFGVLACCMDRPVDFVVSFHSQQKALRKNMTRNAIDPALIRSCLVTEPLSNVPELALVRMPKSLGLFEWYLSQLARKAEHSTTIAVGFMTRYFTPGMVQIAKRYAREVQQSKARKKARIMVLKDLVGIEADAPLLSQHIPFQGMVFQQYYGVFSAGHIDYATQYLLPFLLPATLQIPQEAPISILDLACGNGVIGAILLQRFPNANLIATDDSQLAVASARLNLPADRSRVIGDDTLDLIPSDSQDVVVTNPPFHLGHETNIEVSLGLFHQVKRVLKEDGQFLIVANRHLNYMTHLQRLFSGVEVLGEEGKFVVYRCVDG